MAKVWWEVKGEYTAVNDKNKPVRYRYCNVFEASSKTDAVQQAKKDFAQMAKDDPSGKYANFTKISAEVERR